MTAQERPKTGPKRPRTTPKRALKSTNFENTCNHQKKGLWIASQGQAAGGGGHPPAFPLLFKGLHVHPRGNWPMVSRLWRMVRYYSNPNNKGR